jgi:Fe-S-cluster-containing dehydrogenase component/mono/diheme cytochrome c family protein
MAKYQMIVDMARCVGCDACTVACKQENGTPLDTFFARVLNLEIGEYPHVKRLYLPVLCNHCEDPVCLKACPNKAIFKRQDGIVLIDQDRCKGTGACVSACPYGNIILSDKNQWYLNEEEPYEKDFVRPRINEGVAKKCTYCAHRVDEGLKPACVVACPASARIFGDAEDPESDVSRYIAAQEERGREPFVLLPQAKTKPTTAYFGPLAHQDVSVSTVQGVPLPEPVTKEVTREPALKVVWWTILLALLFLFLSSNAGAQRPVSGEVFQSSACSGCHGLSGMGGMGPPLASTKLDYQTFLKTVRNGKGMMPATAASVTSDKEVDAIYSDLKGMAWQEDQIPVAFKVGGLLSTHNTAKFFMVVGIVALLFALRVLAYFVRCAGIKELWPFIGRFGYLRSAGIFLKALVVDGLFVSSLYKRSRFRWAMHGLMLYGFLGLLLSDVLMQIYNPTRGDLPLANPLKMTPIVCGFAVLFGVFYVMFRYKRDVYIDNGITLGRDYLFLNLLFHTTLSGLLVLTINRLEVTHYVMPIYIYHLSAVTLLIVSAPFTRFQHAFVVPVMVGLTRVTEAITVSGVEIGYEREPSPGRHHKSLRIAEQIAEMVEPGARAEIRLRYYP